jgi:DNA-binding MarR family transcriptional regulator
LRALKGENGCSSEPDEDGAQPQGGDAAPAAQADQSPDGAVLDPPRHRYKISLNEFRLLMTIGALERTASHELAELTGVNVMSVSRAVATLQRHGRIEVVRDPANRRRKWLTLTDEGRRLYEIMRPQSEKVADYLFSELAPAEVEQLGKILTHLIDTLEARDAEGNSLFIERTKPDTWDA